MKKDNRRGGRWTAPRRIGFAAAVVTGACLGLASCQTFDNGIAGLDNTMSRIPGVGLPDEVETARTVIRTIRAIAQYRADQQQLAEARRKANRSSSERQYIRVRPSSSAPRTSAPKETHVVAYDPKTDTVDDKVLVVDESLSRGDSVSINGQTGKII